MDKSILGVVFARSESVEEDFDLSIDIHTDGTRFQTNVYVALEILRDLAKTAASFDSETRFTSVTMVVGRFGPQSANGAFECKLENASPGVIKVMITAESSHYKVADQLVASKLVTFAQTTLGSLDSFVDQLNRMANKEEYSAQFLFH